MEVKEAIDRNRRELFSIYTLLGKHKIEQIELSLNIPEFFSLFMIIKGIKIHRYKGSFMCSGNLLCNAPLDFFLGNKVAPMKHLRPTVLNNLILVKENSVPP